MGHHWPMARGGAVDDTRRMQVWPLVLPGTLAAAIALTVGRPLSDWPLASAGGHYLLSGHLTVYADMAYVQMGPLSLVLAGALPGSIYLAAVCALLPLILWTAMLPYPPTRQTYLATLFGGLLLAWPWAAFAVQGHGDDALVVVGIVAMVSALKLHRGVWVVAAFLVALASKPTAILFLPLVFLRSRRAGIVATLAGGLLWAPFVLADVPGFLAAGRGQGDLWPYSLPDLLGGVPHTGFPEWLRLVQLIGGVAMCWFLARRRGPAAAVAGVFAFRVLLEPGTSNYYSTSVIAAAILLDLHRGQRVPWATILGFVSFVATFGEPPITLVGGFVRILSLTAVLALAFAPRQRSNLTSDRRAMTGSGAERPRAPSGPGGPGHGNERPPELRDGYVVRQPHLSWRPTGLVERCCSPFLGGAGLRVKLGRADGSQEIREPGPLARDSDGCQQDE